MSRKTDRNSANSGSASQAQRRAGLRQLASASVVIVVFVAIYALSVSNRLKDTERHGLDSLVQITESVHDYLTNSLKIVDSLTKPGYACEFFERQSRLTLTAGHDCDKINAFALKANSKYASNRSERKNDAKDDSESGLTLERALVAHSRGFTIDACLFPKYRWPEFGPTQVCEEQSGMQPVSIDVSLDEVLDASTFGTAFESIVIADHASDVVIQHAPSSQELFQPPGRHAQHQALSVSIGNLRKLIASDAGDDELSESHDGATTSVNKVRLAGARYTLICQPLDVYAVNGVAAVANLADGQQSSFQICGLINGGNSLRDSLEVASPLVIAMLAFVLIGIIAWPLVKLATLRARERMHFVEVYVSVLATIALLMIGTVLLLCTDRALMGNDATRARLAHMAEMLERNMMEEFSDARDALNNFDASLDQLGEAWLTTCASSTDRPGVCECDDAVASDDAGSCKTSTNPSWLLTDMLVQPRSDGLKGYTRPDKYPFLSQIFLMNLDNGMQLLKASSRGANTPKVSVAKRDYYKTVRDGALWSPKSANGDYFVQSFRSITTGEFSAALSTRSANQWHEIDSRLSAEDAELYKEGLGIVMALKPLSLVNQVLAPGVSYAVIDNATGTAVFHSDLRHATVENLFRDEGIADRLKAAIQAKATVSFDGRYRTQANYVHVRPLAAIPWTIVLFENASVSRTSSVEVLSLATLMVALHLLVLGLLTGLYLANNGRETPSWIWPAAHWPHTDRIALFRGGCWWLIAWALLALTAVSVLDGSRLWWALALPQAVVVVFLFAGAAKMLNRHYARTFERQGRWVLVASLIGCFAVSARSQQMWADGPSPVTSLYLVLLALTLWWTSRRDIPVAGAVRWAIVVAAAGLIGAVWFADSPLWALWCSIAFLVCYLMMPLASWSSRLRGYQLRSVLVWLAIAVPPAVGYFKIAHERELDVFHALESDYTMRASDFRRHELEEQFRKIEVPLSLRETANTSALLEDGAEPPVAENNELSPAADSKNILAELALEKYTVKGLSRMCYLPYRRDARGEGGGGENEACPRSDARAKDWSTLFDRNVKRLFPIYNEMTRRARYVDPQPGKAEELAQATGASDRLVVEQQALEFSLPIGVSLVVGAFVGLGLLWAWVAYGARRLFFGELDAHIDSLSVEEIIEHQVEKHTFATLATRAQYAFITETTDAHDVYRLSSTQDLKKLEQYEGGRSILCTHLGDALRDDSMRRCVLSVLEKLSQLPQGRVIVLSSVPIAKTSSAVSDNRTPQDDHRLMEFPFENDGESARWRGILADFESLDVSIRGSFASTLATKASLTQLPDTRWLNEELGAIAGLSSLMGSDYQTALTRPLTRREVIKEIGKRADWFYRSLWDNCSTDEKLVLTQLSREGVVNPRQVNAVRSLLARGLLRMDPVLKPINNSFGRYVASVFDAPAVEELETAGRTAGFNMRRVLLGLILLVLLFLWFTQRDVVDTWITYLAGITGAMISVLKVLDSLKGGATSR